MREKQRKSRFLFPKKEVNLYSLPFSFLLIFFIYVFFLMIRYEAFFLPAELLLYRVASRFTLVFFHVLINTGKPMIKSRREKRQEKTQKKMVALMTIKIRGKVSIPNRKFHKFVVHAIEMMEKSWENIFRISTNYNSSFFRLLQVELFFNYHLFCFLFLAFQISFFVIIFLELKCKW